MYEIETYSYKKYEIIKAIQIQNYSFLIVLLPRNIMDYNIFNILRFGQKIFEFWVQRQHVNPTLRDRKMLKINC